MGRTKDAGVNARDLVCARRKVHSQFCSKKWALPAGGRGKIEHDKTLPRHVQDHVAEVPET